MLSKIILYLRKYALVIVLLVFDLGYFSSVDPAAANSFMIMIGCVLVIVSVYLLWFMFGGFLDAWTVLPSKHRRKFVLAGTLLTVFMLLMQSIGQLSARDIAAAVPLTLILYLYFVHLSQPPARRNGASD